MSQVKLPSNATVLYVNGVASLSKDSDKPLAAGEYLKAGEMLDVAEPTLIEFLGEDGGIYFYVGGEIDSLAAILNDPNQLDADKAKIQELFEAIKQGVDPTQNDEYATEAGTTLQGSGSNGFIVLYRSGGETIASAGYDTENYATSGTSQNPDVRGDGDNPFFSTPIISLNVQSLTNDNTPTISGTTNMPPGSIVSLTIIDATGKAQTLTAIVQEGGFFSVDIADALGDGAFSVTATVSDSQGNSASATATGMVDTFAPEEGTGPGGTDELPIVEIPEATGGIGEGVLTDGVQVLVTAPTGTEPGDTITVTVTQPDGSTNNITATVPDGWTGGSVSVTVSPEDLGGTGGGLPAEGEYTITASVTDSAGNTSAPSTSTTVTIDTTAPGEGTGSGGTDELPLVEIPEATGGIGEDELADGVQVLVTPPTGTEPGDTITVTVTQPDGSTNNITATVPSDWTNGSTVPLTLSSEDLGSTDGSLPAEGNYTVTATVTDSAGNTSTSSSNVEFIVDTTPPDAPTIDELVTNDTTPVITGTATLGEGETLTVTLNGVTYENVPVQGDGTWSIEIADANALTEGSFDITATTQDSAGNTSFETTGQLVIDITPPDSPVVSITDDVNNDGFVNTAEQGADNVQLSVSVDHTDLTQGGFINVTVNNGGVSNTLNFKLSNGALTFTDDTAATGYSYSNGVISWSETVSSGNTLSVSATQTDIGGNVSGSSADSAIVTVATDDTSTSLEDTTNSGNVLTNDSGNTSVVSFVVHGDATTYSAGQTATLNGIGTLTLSANGAYVFTPNADWNGTVPDITYTTNSGDTATIDISVTSVDDAVDAVNDTYSVNEDDSVTLNLLSNDSAPDGGLQITHINGVALVGGAQNITVSNGTVVIASDDTISFKPDANYFGQVNFTYQVKDADGDTDTASVDITVNPQSDAVDAIDDTYTVAQDNSVALNLLGNDAAPDGGLAITHINGVALTGGAQSIAVDNGSVVIASDGSMSFESDASFYGDISFNYQINDADGDTDTASVTITGNASAPTVTAVSSTSANEGDTASVTVSLSNESTTVTRVFIEPRNGVATEGSDFDGEDIWVNYGSGWVQASGDFSSGNWIDVPANTTSFQVRTATLQDGTFEGDEHLKIYAKAEGQGGTVAGTVTIVDDEDPIVVESITQYSDGVEGSTNPGWTVNFNNPTDVARTVRLNFNDTKHESDMGDDYSGKVFVYDLDGNLIAETVISPATDSIADISVPANAEGIRVFAETLDDNVYEGSETIQIQAAVLGSGTGFVESEQAVITDEADKPTLSIVNTNTNNEVLESNWATFTIQLSNPVAESTKVKVTMLTGTDSNMTDQDVGIYQYWTGSNWAHFKSGSQLTFDAFQTEILIKTQPINENIAESNETLSVSVEPIATETNISGGEAQSSVTIIDVGTYDVAQNPAFIHWHIDSDGIQHFSGNSWHPNEEVTISGPDGSERVVYADSSGNFHLSGADLFTAAGVVTANGDSSGSAYRAISPSITPLVLDLDGDGIETSDVTENPVSFDFDGDGETINTGWITGGDGLLVRDINNDGEINDGSELFGSNTSLSDGSTASDGYEALAQHDTNADGVIDQNDAIYSELGVWVDKDMDGETDEGELLSLEDAGVASINLDAQTTDDIQNNNVIGKTSTYTTTDGEERAAADVWFATQQAEEETNLAGLVEESSISGLDSSELVWHSNDVSSQPSSDTVTDFTVGQSTLNLSDLVIDSQDNLLSEDNIDMFEQDGSLVLRVDTDGDHTWNQEIILQDVSFNDIVDENGVIKSGVFGDDNVKELFQKAASTDVVENSQTHLDDPNIDHL